nr:CHRD domain-containing protein [Micromonospora sp. DSM 115978]
MTGRARQMVVATVAGAVAVVVAVAGMARAGEDGQREQDGRDRIPAHQRLTGYVEDPLAISTDGEGRFRIRIDEPGREIAYELSYADLSAAVTQAHIHFGGRAQSGGISVFLCTNLGNGPVGTQACPAAPATITGVIEPVDVIGPTGQGIGAGEFDELVDAIRAGATYVNVHSASYPGGEIRAQLGHHRH